MQREQLVAEARIAAKAAKHNLKLIRKNPEKVLPGKMAYVEGQLLKMMEFEKWEKKNARRPGRTSLVSTRLKELFMVILPQKHFRVK